MYEKIDQNEKESGMAERKFQNVLVVDYGCSGSKQCRTGQVFGLELNIQLI